MKERKAHDLYKQIIEKAAAHGLESDPDHEVGDLQEALSAAIKLLTDDQLDTLKKELEDSLW